MSGNYFLFRGYDLIVEIPGPDIFGEDAVFVPVSTNFRDPHVPQMPAVRGRTEGNDKLPIFFKMYVQEYERYCPAGWYIVLTCGYR